MNTAEPSSPFNDSIPRHHHHQDRVDLKVTFEPSGVIRRFSVDAKGLQSMTLDQVSSLITDSSTDQNTPTSSIPNPQQRQRFPRSSLRLLQYQDDEGDWITINSNEELHEAFTFLDPETQVIRLKAKMNTLDESRGESGFEYTPSGGPAAFEGLMSQIRRSVEGLFASTSPNSSTSREQSPGRSSSSSFSMDSILSSLPDISVERLQSALFQMAQFSHDKAEEAFDAIQNLKTMGTQRACRKVNQWIDQSSFDLADAVLNQLYAVNRSHPELYYSWARYYARRYGDEDQAAAYLCQAAAFGFTDMERARQDSAFILVRNSSGFKSALEEIRNASRANNGTTYEDVVDADFFSVDDADNDESESDTFAENEPLNLDESSDNLLDENFDVYLSELHEMGFDDDTRNSELLHRFKGDLEAVIAELVN